MDDFIDVTFAGDDVVGHVEIGSAGAAIDRVPGCHLDIIGDALDALDAVREFAERRGDQHLALFLECAHAAAIGLRGAAKQDHWPAILLGIGEAGETVHHAGAGHDDAGAGTAGQIAVGLRRVGGGLLVAHADIGNAFLLRGCGDRGDRKTDDPEQVIDTLLFEAPRYQGSAIEFAHALLLVTDFSRDRAAKGVLPAAVLHDAHARNGRLRRPIREAEVHPRSCYGAEVPRRDNAHMIAISQPARTATALSRA